MTQNELNALRHAAEGSLLFHNGLWGTPAGYRWAAPDGSSAGHVPQWECETLDLLERRQLIAIRPATGARDVPVVVTAAGARAMKDAFLALNDRKASFMAAEQGREVLARLAMVPA